MPPLLEPTSAVLKEHFHYRSDGELVWSVAPLRHPQLVGLPAGFVETRGEKRVQFKGSRFKLHRLIYIYFNGSIPSGLTVDHKDRDPSNNRIENLRLATPRQQKANTLFLGFSTRQDRPKPYRIHVTTESGSVIQPSFKTALQARLKYEEVGLQEYGEFFPPLLFTEIFNTFIAGGGPPLHTTHSYQFLSN